MALGPVWPFAAAAATSSATIAASAAPSMAAGRYVSMMAISARSFVADSVRPACS
ncbi:unannotated protein [freshwater metagenome]|uniref:Unannotated protein n=1 Tax=freshwater metagenome TaxID=449393 RepID=A0A6J6FXW9_9ZZZZ